MAIDLRTLEGWLTAYGRAWETRDADAAAALFSSNANYFETPYAEPFAGSAGVREYWARVTSDHSDVKFRHTIVGLADGVGVARWNAKLTLASTDGPLELDGVFLLTFDADGLCKELREWWHAR